MLKEKLTALLKNKAPNHILPFFWQHGEDEETLRHYMEIIQNSNIGAVCVESRPHPDFCGPKWWEDMDIILEEARARNMKVWILDDSHFPTGYANGAIKEAPINLRRQSVTYKALGEAKGGEVVELTKDQYQDPKPHEKSMIETYVLRDELQTFNDDRLLGVIAVKNQGSSANDILHLPETNGKITWTPPSGNWKLYAIHLTRNRGPHRDYINMLSWESCNRLIQAVYEPHYARYKADFGKTIAGFFSDEPELGNGHLYQMGKNLFEVDDQPWSEEIEAALMAKWGKNWVNYLPLIWENDFDPGLKAKIRYDYMDAVTRTVEKDFSYQLGDWCRARGVEYIGHIIEDNNQHSRNGSSLGHFFRGMSGQDMAGIDNIGGQVLPQGEVLDMRGPLGSPRDGIFFHYMLGKLASTAAAIEPLKKGRAMCENFGNYGWEGGVYLMKYLADHFMVRGVNRYVPHAFTPKAFPDPDCPPHFYAHGHNPQYRHFGYLMSYMNRVCELISDGRHIAPAAILYHGEADWTGGKCMFSQEPAMKLADRQIDYDIIPPDIFAEDKYNTVLGETLKVNTQEYKVLIVPETSFISAEVAQAIAKLLAEAFPVVFINSLPIGIYNGGGCLPNSEMIAHTPEDAALLEGISKCQVVSLDGLIGFMDALNVADITLAPANNRLRYMRYTTDSDMYYFFNEGAETYRGEITIPATGGCYAYNPWDNILETVEAKEQANQTTLTVTIEPRKSLIVVFGEPSETPTNPLRAQGKPTPLNGNWSRSTCTSKAYPAFENIKNISLPDDVAKEDPKFGGFVRYEKTIDLTPGKTILEISDAAEGVEVFVNGVSAGIQIVPTFLYDITPLVKEGQNHIAIEVATTLERAVERRRHPMMQVTEPSNRCGLCGTVTIWR